MLIGFFITVNKHQSETMEGRGKPCEPMVSQESVPCGDNSTGRLSSSDHGSLESEQ